MVWTWALVKITKILKSNNWCKSEQSSSTIRWQNSGKVGFLLAFQKDQHCSWHQYIGVSNFWVGNATKQKQHLQSLSRWLEAVRHSNCQSWITASEWWGLHISLIRAQPNQKTNPCTARDQQIRFLPVCTWLNVLLSIIWVIYSSMRAEQTGLQGNLARFNTSSSLGSSI